MADDTLSKIKHYKKKLEKYISISEDDKVLSCIQKLKYLPVTVNHLELTEVGKTINSLRHKNGIVGEKARALVDEWKKMVREEEQLAAAETVDSRYESPTYATVTSAAGDVEDVYEGSEEEEGDRLQIEEGDEGVVAVCKPGGGSTLEADDCNGYNPRTSQQDYISVGRVAPDGPSPNYQPSRSVGYSPARDDKHDDVTIMNGDAHDVVYRSRATSDKEEKTHKKRHKSRHESSTSKSHHDAASPSKSSKSHHKSSKHKSSSSSPSKRHHKSSSKSSSSRHKEKESLSTLPIAATSEENAEVPSASANNDFLLSPVGVKLTAATPESDKRHSKERSRHRSSSRHNSSAERKHHRSHKEDSKEFREKRHSSSPSKEERREDDKSSKRRRGDEEQQHQVDGGEAGFGAALLGMESSPSKKKKKKKRSKEKPERNSTSYLPTPQASIENFKVPTPSVSARPLLPFSILDDDDDCGLSARQLTTNYQPLPHVPQRHAFRDPSDNDTGNDLGFMFGSKTNKFRRIYAGKAAGRPGYVPSLIEACKRVVQKCPDVLRSLCYLDAPVPFELLRAVLEKVTPAQLEILEDYNPYLLDDTDVIWALHCKKHFKGKEREEMETWREMYYRCSVSEAERMRNVTKSIGRKHVTEAAPKRVTQLAFCHSAAKPPKSVARAQAKYGTGSSAAPVHRTPGAAASLSSCPKAGSSSTTVPLPPRPDRPITNRQTTVKRPKVAPLMGKARQLLRKVCRR